MRTGSSARGGGRCVCDLGAPGGRGSPCVRVCVRAHARVSCVSVPCAHGGPVPCAHMCSQPCVSVSCLILPLPVSCLGGCWASHGLVGQFVAMLVHVTSDPEHAYPWLGLTSCQPSVCGNVWPYEQDFLCPWWQVCVFACVFQHWPEYLCQSQHGCPGRVWMWVVWRGGVCECVPWNPTVYETPLGRAGVSPAWSVSGDRKAQKGKKWGKEENWGRNRSEGMREA